MVENNHITVKLSELMQKTGYTIVEQNGHRKTGPPPDWTGSPPPKGCEVFVGKLPRDIYEDELVPLFLKVGRIYELRLMMDYTGSNRGYAFVTFSSRVEAAAAVKQLNGHEIRRHKHIGVVKSVDNCRLFIRNIPRTKTKEDLRKELSIRVKGVVDVILSKSRFDRGLNRGFAFLEFTSHNAAVTARWELVRPGCNKLWDKNVHVDWAEPEPDIDDEQMAKVKVLYVRNFAIRTVPEVIQKAFKEAINCKVERVRKIYDYAFIHFFERKHAELAMEKLQNANIDGSNIEILWAKPVDSDLYRIQKLGRGNSKFNNFCFGQEGVCIQQPKRHRVSLCRREFIRLPIDVNPGYDHSVQGDLIQQSVSAAMHSSLPAMQSCMRLPYDYPAMYPRMLPSVVPLTIPKGWRTY